LQTPQISQDEPILTAANRLLTELKKAYMQILQEKEEQIMHLKEEQADLKTLVRVLEAENERLSRRN
jgi:riboflavin biosynthesis pyrimidine reductase